MDDLVSKVASTAGISQEQAQKAVQAVMDFARSKLPPQYAGMVDQYLGGQAAPAGNPLAGMFGS